MVNSTKRRKGFFSGRVKANDGLSRKTLRQQHQRALNYAESQRWSARWNAMTNKERRQFTRWSRTREAQLDESQSMWEDVSDGDEDANADEQRMDDVLRGEEVVELSHEGEEYGNLIGEMSDDILNHLLQAKAISKKDRRTRRDRTQRRTNLFVGQMPQLVAAFAHWDATRGETGYESLEVEPLDGEVRVERVWVVDMFRSYYAEVPTMGADEHVATAFVRVGLIPCAPLRPTKAVTVRTLEFYRRARNRCPRYSMQAFCGTLSDIQEAPARRYLCQQMSICFDLLVSLREGVDKLVQQALHRDTPNWRLANACAPCFYKIKDEPQMDISVLMALDGNNSLSRVKSVKSQEAGMDADGPAEVNERIDWRDGRGDYILHPAKVEMWADATDPAKKWEGNGEPEESGCEERWHNMTHDVSSRMWGIYEETGIFLAVCRHGMTMLIGDMIRSGELSKYPLALVNELLDAIDDMEDFFFGYDIGCRFKKTVDRSKLGEKARKRRLKFACGLFHGHAHSRKCQLWNLGTYIDGMGLEDLEICERVFSKSNSLASIVRHASTFHRHQAIRSYFKHMDEVETFQGISIFLYNNIKQALDIIDKRPLLLQEMSQLGVQHTNEFYDWLQAERTYLLSLRKEPEEESLRIEYVKALERLEELEESRDFYLSNTDAPTLEGNSPQEIAGYEKRRRYALKRHRDKQEEVSHLEDKMNIAQTWGKGSAERKEAEELLRTREYRLAIDKLEELVVCRIFELTKMNMSQTGYKLRKHIAKALQTRSKAVKRALQKYNDAARRLRPPGRQLEWDEVVSYSFLGQFDLLRDARQDVREQAWATPAGRHAMDTFYKNLRADEEITRCTLEVRRLLTYMRDEENYLKAAYLFHKESKPDVAYQIRRRLRYRKKLHEEHRRRIELIRRLPGFDGSTLVEGERAGPRAGYNIDVFQRAESPTPPQPPSSDPGPACQPVRPEMCDDDDDYDGDIDGEFEWEFEGDDEDEEDEMEALESALAVAGISDDTNIKMAPKRGEMSVED